MKQLQITFDLLARTANPFAVDVLRLALAGSDPQTRRRAIHALLARPDAASAEQLLEHWDQLDGDEIALIQDQKRKFANVVAAGLQADGPRVALAIKAADHLQLNSALPSLIALVESSDSTAVRSLAGDVLLRMAEALGQRARQNRDQATLRGPVVARLLESLHSFSRHQSESLIDALLAVSAWQDSELRALLETPSPARELILRRLHNSVQPGPIELLAGFLGRRELPAGVGEIIQTRDDQPFRDALLKQIGDEPSVTTLKNLRLIGLPQCCRGGEQVADSVPLGQLPALIHLYAAASQDDVEKLQVIAAAAHRGGDQVMAAAALSLADCGTPDAHFWMRAAMPIADGQTDRIAAHEGARLLDRLIRLLAYADGGLVRSIRDVLSPLLAENIIHRIGSLRPRSRRRLGKVVRMIDPDAIARARDALRHPVLAQRLRAIDLVDSLQAADALADSLAHIANEDHQDARIRVAEVLATAEGAQTWQLLEEMAALPDCGVRDAALIALDQRRGAATTPEAPFIAHLLSDCS